MAVASLAWAAAAFAQPTLTVTDGTTPSALEPGSPPTSYPLSAFEHYSPYTGQISFAFPLHHIGGRGTASFDMTLHIQPQPWTVESFPGTGGLVTIYPAWWTIGAGYSPGALWGRESAQFTTCPGNPTQVPQHTLGRLTFIGPDGTETELRDTATDGEQELVGNNYCGVSPQFYNRGTTFASRDGSSMVFISDTPVMDFNPGPANSGSGEAGAFVVSGYLYFRDGTTYRIDRSNVSWIQDRNGNQIGSPTAPLIYNTQNEVTSLTDQNGRTTMVAYLTSPCAGHASACDQITYPGWDGASLTVEVGYNSLGNLLRPDFKQESTASLFWEASQPYCPPPCNFNPQQIVSYIRYPDGGEFSFQYDSYGEVAEITVPTGGAYQYDYGGLPPNTSGSGFQDSYPAGWIDRLLLARREYASGDLGAASASGSTAYGAAYGLLATSPFAGVQGPVQTVARTITSYDLLYPNNPALQTIHTYGGNPENVATITGTAYDGWWEGLEIETQWGQPSVLRTQNQWWQQWSAVTWCEGACWLGGPVSIPQMYQANTALNDTNQVSEISYAYDAYNNVTSKSEYDFGTGAPGGLKRVTATNYVTTPAYVSQSVNLVSLPLSVVVSNGTSAYAQTEYCYDGQTTLASWCNGQTSAISPESNIVGHNSAFGTSFTTRGNVTFLSRWLNTTNGWLNTTATYDIAGNAMSVTDPLKNTTTASYLNYPQNAYASPTSITNALLQTTTWTYDYSTGKPATSTDPNNVMDAYVFNDPLERLTQVRTATGAGQCTGPSESDTNYSYPTPNIVYTHRDQNRCDDQALATTVIYDGMGRKSSALQGDPLGTIEIDNAYDGLDRSYSVSNPYQSGAETPHYTANFPYDSLGRIQAQTTDDGAATATSYSGNTTTVSDPAGVTHTHTTDALGRLISVLEAPNTPLQFPTSYAYDPLDDLTQVCSGTTFNTSGNCPAGYQFRTYGYDSLKRLTSAANPETASVAITYTYDADGNLLTKSDPNRNTLTMGYDGLNRVISKSYSVTSPTLSTPSVTYCYDNTPQGACASAPSGNSGNLIGRLTLVSSSVSSTAYNSYDPRGNIVQSTQTTGAVSYPFSYTYNLANTITGETLPSGRTVAWGYDSANRISSLTGTPPGGMAKTYASSVLYASQGDVSQINLGNLLVEVRTYDSYRQQPIGVTLGTSATDSSSLALGFAYCPSAAPGSPCTTNNGNLQSQTIEPLNVTETYTYDTLNRLLSAAEGTGTGSWSETFKYDSYGNRWVPSSAGITLSNLTPTVNYYNSATNRFQSSDANFNYDNNGNQALVSPYAIAYDAENRQATIAISGSTTAAYGYDGEGRRVTKTIAGGSATTYIYDANGELAAEYSTAPPTLPCATCYLTADHLGSTRLLTNQPVDAYQAGAPVSRHDYLPFGEELTTANRTATLDYGVTDNVNQKFTGKERDPETGIDYFGFRYFSSGQGRWTSPDAPFADQHPEDPQSWNMYGYVRNNPLKNTDPDGKACSILNNGSGFCQRADLYANFDDLVHSKTRFFAAASAASQELGDAAVFGFGRAAVSPETKAFLESTGQALQKVNVAAVGQILSGQMNGSEEALDSAMVHKEQTAVQKQLDLLKGANPDAYSTAVKEINALLNSNGAVASTLVGLGNAFFATDKAYYQFLGDVRKSLGHDIDFANQQDREAIGNALVKHIQQTGGCDVAGNRANGCNGS